MPRKRPPTALTIAGSDSGGGAGIQADLKTFTALGVYGMSAITALTAQNTRGVSGVHNVPPDFVAQQIDAVAQDIAIDAAKTGMLATAPIIEAVAQALSRNRIKKIVVDPVMVAKSGDVLLQKSAKQALIKQLLPLAYIVTPNIPEAEALIKRSIVTQNDIEETARRIHDFGPKFVLMKGGHLKSKNAVDYLFDGKSFVVYSAKRIATKNTHGTGCTFSAAIAAYLAKKYDATEAVELAKQYLTNAIRSGFGLGSGHGPLNHFWLLPDGF